MSGWGLSHVWHPSIPAPAPSAAPGSMVNERVGAGNWESGDELGTTWASRNAFSYGRGAERGAARPEVGTRIYIYI